MNLAPCIINSKNSFAIVDGEILTHDLFHARKCLHDLHSSWDFGVILSSLSFIKSHHFFSQEEDYAYNMLHGASMVIYVEFFFIFDCVQDGFCNLCWNCSSPTMVHLYYSTWLPILITKDCVKFMFSCVTLQWAEVLSADAFSAFEDAGLDSDKVCWPSILRLQLQCP